MRKAGAAQWLERVELAHVADVEDRSIEQGDVAEGADCVGAPERPELCVLDEPTTGLDPVNVRLVQELLLERRRNGRTTILSTHQMNQVEALCDRIAMINRGQLMVYGPVGEVRRDHSLPEVRVHARGPLPAYPLSPALSTMAGDRGG